MSTVSETVGRTVSYASTIKFQTLSWFLKHLTGSLLTAIMRSHDVVIAQRLVYEIEEVVGNIGGAEISCSVLGVELYRCRAWNR